MNNFHVQRVAQNANSKAMLVYMELAHYNGIRRACMKVTCSQHDEAIPGQNRLKPCGKAWKYVLVDNANGPDEIVVFTNNVGHNQVAESAASIE